MAIATVDKRGGLAFAQEEMISIESNQPVVSVFELLLTD